MRRRIGLGSAVVAVAVIALQFVDVLPTLAQEPIDPAVTEPSVAVSREVLRDSDGQIVYEGTRENLIGAGGSGFALGDRSIVLDARVINAASTLSSDQCWDWYHSYSLSGILGLQTKSIARVQWCGANGAVTRRLYKWCSGATGSGWEYRGCSISWGPTGFSYLQVDGDWSFRWGASGVYFYRSHRLDSKHYWNGTVSWTWYVNS